MNPKKRPVFKVRDRVKTTAAIGPKLPIGSVGVVISVDDGLYGVTVAFPTLAPGMIAGHVVAGLDPASVPLANAVPFRAEELELIDNLALEA